MAIPKSGRGQKNIWDFSDFGKGWTFYNLEEEIIWTKLCILVTCGHIKKSLKIKL